MRTVRLFCALLLLCVSMAHAERREVTLLFTNDFESTYDPTAAFWRDDMARIGGVAELATLISEHRRRAGTSFLFDAGDIFTGSLAKRTQGEVAFELMISMGYDAMVIGNHEFEYGWQMLARQKQRVPFPVLGANLFYKGTEHPFAQGYAILERKGVRVAVIGILGQDAGNALIPSNIAGVEVRNPVPILKRLVAELRPDVDLIVLLTHQGPTAPMQTDKEADPMVQRGNAENLSIASQVPGLDVIFAGHTDAGTPEPLEHPDTGTLIMQTFGQGQHLGVLEIGLGDAGERLDYEGRLVPVNADRLSPHPVVAAKLQRYREQHADLYEVVGHSAVRLGRRYYQESDLGNAFADVLRAQTGADLALMPSGALRKDLPAGDIRRVDLLDAFPFEDDTALVRVSGALLLEILEQGLSLERGILQVSGAVITYRPDAPVGSRVVEVSVNGRPLEIDRTYSVATLEILAQGGDRYTQFRRASDVRMLDRPFARMLIEAFGSAEAMARPIRGRILASP